MDNLVETIGLEKAKSPVLNGRMRQIPSPAVMYIIGGEGHFCDRDTPDQRIGPGTVFFLYPGIDHTFDPYPETLWTEYWLVFNGAEAERRFGNLLPQKTLHPCGIIPGLADAYEDLYHDMRSRATNTPELQCYGLHRILGLIYRHLNRPNAPELSPLITSAIAAMQRQLAEPTIDLPELAGKFGVSYETLRKQFRRQTGRAPHEYFLEMKITAARNLLWSGYSIKETADELGFNDPYYFSRLFKLHSGLSPSQLVVGRSRNVSGRVP